MKLFKKLNIRGFAHVELLTAVLVIGLVVAIGAYVYGHDRSHADSPNWTVVAKSSSNSSEYIEACQTEENSLVGGIYQVRVLYWKPNSWSGSYGYTVYKGNTSTVRSTNSGTGYYGNVVAQFIPSASQELNDSLYVYENTNNGDISNTSINPGSLATCSSPPTGCASTPPTISTDPLYPLQNVVSFTGSTLPSQWQDYGNTVQQPGGYVAADHAVFVPGTGLELKGYPDKISGKIGGITGASGDVSINVANSGGFDVCLSMTPGNWQNVQLVVISWPTDNVWGEGENDIFDGGGTWAQIFVHNIGSDPANNAYIGNWPSSILTGTHEISARWDPVHGYRYYLDGVLEATAKIGGNVIAPTTPHHLAIQLQDVGENSTNSESATVYWAASYGYSAQAN